MSPSIKYVPLQPEGEDKSGLVRPLNDFMQSTAAFLRSQPSSVFATLKFRTNATVANTFPIDVSLPENFAPRTVVIGKVIDWTTPDTAITSALWVHWRPSTAGLTVLYIANLTASHDYEMELEVRGG